MIMEFRKYSEYIFNFLKMRTIIKLSSNDQITLIQNLKSDAEFLILTGCTVFDTIQETIQK
jgi:hypothetical protein